MKLILDNENSHSTTVTVKGNDLKLLLTESRILINCEEIAKLFDKRLRTIVSKVNKAKLEKYETDDGNDFYELSEMLEGPALYYFKKEKETDLIEIIIRVADGKHREWLHNREIDK